MFLVVSTLTFQFRCVSRFWYTFEVKSTSIVLPTHYFSCMLYILINICKLYVGKELNNY